MYFILSRDKNRNFLIIRGSKLLLNKKTYIPVLFSSNLKIYNVGIYIWTQISKFKHFMSLYFKSYIFLFKFFKTKKLLKKFMILSIPLNWVNSYKIIYGRISINFFSERNIYTVIIFYFLKEYIPLSLKFNLMNN